MTPAPQPPPGGPQLLRIRPRHPATHDVLATADPASSGRIRLQRLPQPGRMLRRQINLIGDAIQPKPDRLSTLSDLLTVQVINQHNQLTRRHRTSPLLVGWAVAAAGGNRASGRCVRSVVRRRRPACPGDPSVDGSLLVLAAPVGAVAASSLVRAGWKVRPVVMGIAVVQVFQEGLWWLSGCVAGLLALTYLVPWWRRRWAAAAVTVFDEAVLAVGRRDDLSRWLRQVDPVRNRDRITALENPQLGPRSRA